MKDYDSYKGELWFESHLDGIATGIDISNRFLPSTRFCPGDTVIDASEAHKVIDVQRKKEEVSEMAPVSLVILVGLEALYPCAPLNNEVNGAGKGFKRP